ncbi:MAG: hypothetical protein HY335_01340, partial [Deinococcus sp.]|nr:hypothetical protein [Deinococcus sp.]
MQKRLPAVLLFTLVTISHVLAQPDAAPLRCVGAGEPETVVDGSAQDFITLCASETTLSSDGSQVITLLALLVDAQGNRLPEETVRFSLESGVGQLEATEPGSDVFLQAGGDAFAGTQAVTGVPLGDGQYAARFLGGNTAGTALVRAIWVSANELGLDRRLPAEEITLTLTDVTAAGTPMLAGGPLMPPGTVDSLGELAIVVANPTLLANARDQTTVVAYLFDRRGRPLNNKAVTFNVVRGTGTISGVDGNAIIADNGRYAAVYTAGDTPSRRIVDAAGDVSFEDRDVVRATVADGTTFLSDTVQITLFDTVVLRAFAFPTAVERTPPGAGPDWVPDHAIIILSVVDGREFTVPGFTPDNLAAEVIAGPGTVTEIQEIPLASGLGSGVYQATYIAGDAIGRATVKFTDLTSNHREFVTVDIDVVQEAGTVDGIAIDVQLSVFGLPLNADGQSEGLVLAQVLNQDENPVTGTPPEFRVIRGPGTISGEVLELEAQAVGGGTGIYATTFLAGITNVRVESSVRATVVNTSGETIIATAPALQVPNLGPRIVVFPPRLPADQLSLATIDIIDFDANTDLPEEFADDRYLIDIGTGGGRIVLQPRNDGQEGDLVAGDHIHTALYQAGAAFQEVEFIVTDTLTSGLPTARAQLTLGSPTLLAALAFPDLLDPQEAA